MKGSKIRQHLINRLDEIGETIRDAGKGLALIGLGSAGSGLDRLDDYSDLDFFVLAKDGHKDYFLNDLSWLESIQPVVFSFKNTVDGYKLLFADDIFCEMAVFEADQLQNIPYAQARLVWQDESSSLEIPESNQLPARPDKPPGVDFLLGEALANLYVGLGRFRRGEKLTAVRFIQQYAVGHVMALAPHIEPEEGNSADAFDKDRRFEQRFPRTAAALPGFMQGYEKSPQSALAILHFLELNFSVNTFMKKAIHQLADHPC